jgi:hypothetical protein
MFIVTVSISDDIDDEHVLKRLFFYSKVKLNISIKTWWDSIFVASLLAEISSAVSTAVYGHERYAGIPVTSSPIMRVCISWVPS